MHKLEFCLLAIGNLVEDKDKKLSKQLIQLSNEAHYYFQKMSKKNGFIQMSYTKNFLISLKNFKKKN